MRVDKTASRSAPVVGTLIPVHVKCELGNFGEGKIWHNSILGVGNKEQAIQIIKDSIGRLTEEAAISFFKTRDEM